MRSILRWIIILAVPVVLTMTIVRLLTLPWYPAWAYRQPGFPDDPLGMAQEERLVLARGAIRSLNLPRGVSLLNDLTLPDGTPAFNDREIEHMEDVKLVYDRLTVAAAILLTAAVAAGIGLALRGERCTIWLALALGGSLSLALLVFSGVWMLIGFDAFFTQFHGLFFEAETWVFSYSDTLIRLFPLTFWLWAGLIIVGGVSAVALLLLFVGSRAHRRCRR